jgi:DTW domain-containing protein YfiP
MREKCYACMRPISSCMCQYCNERETQTKFVILMHPMEYRKIKNGTGFITNLQLKSCEIIVDIDFTNNKKVNNLIENYNSFVLYPGKDSINLSHAEEVNRLPKNRLFFIIDATWPCAKKMIKLSENLQVLPKISFEVKSKSAFAIKQQPHELCLSTIESVYEVLKNLHLNGVENINLEGFLSPFYHLINYQIDCIKRDDNKHYRPRAKREVIRKDQYKENPMTNIFFENANFNQ